MKLFLFCLYFAIVSYDLHLGEFPYAKCFICGEIGHLSRSCPDNPRGLYPKGKGSDFSSNMYFCKRMTFVCGVLSFD